MFALLALPFKIAFLLLGTLFALLRAALGLLGFLLSPFILIIVAIIAAAIYFT